MERKDISDVIGICNTISGIEYLCDSLEDNVSIGTSDFEAKTFYDEELVRKIEECLKEHKEYLIQKLRNTKHLND